MPTNGKYIIRFRRIGAGQRAYLKYDDGKTEKTLAKSPTIKRRESITSAKLWSFYQMQSIVSRDIVRNFKEIMGGFADGASMSHMVHTKEEYEIVGVEDQNV